MNKKRKSYYVEFIIFNLLFFGLLVGMLLTFNNPSDVDYIILIQFFALLLFGGGFYLISFLYGLYFQNKFSLNCLNIWILSVLHFLSVCFIFVPYWKPTLNLSDLDTRYLLFQSGFQAVSFLAGCFLHKFIVYLKQQKSN
ncbi:hypothetical protein SAMN05428961_11462 [Paenibacillus sp. OK060]|nr:hypothetical protein SAMN05428961_11462 [Paenibacillus sp. OK060]